MDKSFLSAPRFTSDDLKRERSKVTEEEQTKAHEDLYGVPAEQERATQDQVLSLRKELEKIDDDEKVNYLKAMSSEADLFSSDDRDLMLFLQKDELDARAAAARIVTYWDQRVALFGEEAAFRPLTMDVLPLNDEDDWMMPSPYFIVLPKCDAHGRRVMFNDMSRKSITHPSISSPMRLWWCALHVVLRDRDNVTHGELVSLGTGGGASTRRYCRKVTYMFFATLNFLPVRIVGLHFCRPPPMIEYIWPFVLFIAGRYIRCRLHLHVGSQKVILRKLEAFGLTKSMLPTSIGGDYVLHELEKKRAREDS